MCIRDRSRPPSISCPVGARPRSGSSCASCAASGQAPVRPATSGLAGRPSTSAWASPRETRGVSPGSRRSPRWPGSTRGISSRPSSGSPWRMAGGGRPAPAAIAASSGSAGRSAPRPTGRPRSSHSAAAAVAPPARDSRPSRVVDPPGGRQAVDQDAGIEVAGPHERIGEPVVLRVTAHELRDREIMWLQTPATSSASRRTRKRDEPFAPPVRNERGRDADAVAVEPERLAEAAHLSGDPVDLVRLLLARGREEVPGSCRAGRGGERAGKSGVGTGVVGQVVDHPERVAPRWRTRARRSGEAGPATALQVARRVVDASQELLEPLVAGGIPGARIPGDGLRSPARGLASGAQLLEEGKAIEHIAVKARDGLGDRLLRVHLWTFAHDTRADHPPKVRVGERARSDQSPGWLPERISKRPNRPVAGIQAGMTRSTCAEIGPRASANSNASSAARGPSATQTTAPSARFATQPRSCRPPAASITNQRYPTPCTAPTTVASSRSAAGRPSVSYTHLTLPTI